jgi:hypothetical protein
VAEQQVIVARGSAGDLAHLPALFSREGLRASTRFLEYFTVNIRNPNTRLAYAKAVGQFLAWCDERRQGLSDVEPMVVAAYVEQLTRERAPQTVKQHLATIKMLFDWLVIGQVIHSNPTSSVGMNLRFVSDNIKPSVKQVTLQNKGCQLKVKGVNDVRYFTHAADRDHHRGAGSTVELHLTGIP